MPGKAWVEEHRIRGYEVGPDQKTTITTMANLLQVLCPLPSPQLPPPGKLPVSKPCAGLLSNNFVLWCIVSCALAAFW